MTTNSKHSLTSMLTLTFSVANIKKNTKKIYRIKANRHQCYIVIILSLIFISIPDIQAKTILFQQGGNILAGHYLLPTKNQEPKAVILFIHGDGAMDYQANGYYPLIWNQLRKQGYAIFSWDKPGVGNSTGNWLRQSMQDRQSEVRAAINVVQQQYHFSGNKIGLLGFSQAGWVIPAVASNNANVGFIIGIGFAIDWLEQGWYLNKIRMELDRSDQQIIDQAYQRHLKEIAFLKQNPTYEEYQARNNSDLSKQRYEFVLKNYQSNAYNDYKNIQQPMLMLFGENDRNVDIHDSQAQLASLFKDKSNLQVVVIENATHAMLRAEKFNQQTPGIWFWLKLMWAEENAFATDFFPSMNKWLDSL